ncbi:MAG: hypothetical protein KC731_41790 [Myxococcales bacterium]|nr:hypothetical protein [Myxococcales bacterium]
MKARVAVAVTLLAMHFGLERWLWDQDLVVAVSAGRFAIAAAAVGLLVLRLALAFGLPLAFLPVLLRRLWPTRPTQRVTASKRQTPVQ